MRRDYNDLVRVITEYIGERTDDASLSLIEDLADSEPIMENKEEFEKLKQENEDLRRRYKERFQNGNSVDLEQASSNQELDNSQTPEEQETTVLFEDILRKGSD